MKDLDILVGRSETVKLGGEPLTITAPTVENLIGILKISQDLQDIGDDPKKVLEAFEKLKGALEGCAVGLKERNVNIDQLRAIVEIIIKLASPEDVEKLEENGIDVKAGIKKN